MDTTIEITVKRTDIVPTTERAAWLAQHGVPEEAYTLAFDVPILLWEQAGGSLHSDGTPLNWPSDPYKALRSAAVEVAREVGVPNLTTRQAIDVLQKLADERKAAEQEKEARERAQHEEEEAYLQEWLALPDDEVADADGVKIFRVKKDGVGHWGISGRDVLPREDDRYREAFDRRLKISWRLQSEERERKEAAEQAAIDSVTQWAAKRSDHIAAGVKRGYDMGPAIAQLVQDEFEETLAGRPGSALENLEAISFGSPSWGAIDMERRKSPNENALAMVSAFEHTIKTMREAGLPEAVTFDEPEVMRCTVEEEDDGGYVSNEKFTAVVVTVDSPAFPARYLFVRTG